MSGPRHAPALTAVRLSGRVRQAPDAVAQLTRRAWRWAMVSVLLGGVVSFALFAPARWLAMVVHSATDGRVQWPHARGTVWQGEADLLLTGGAGSRAAAHLPLGLRWALRPAWVAGPALRLALSAPCCMTSPAVLEWTPGWGQSQWRWSAHRSQWPADLLAGLGTPWNTLRFEGQLDLRTNGLTVTQARGRTSVRGDLVADAKDMSSSLTPLRPMGSYRLELVGGVDGNDTRLTLSTPEGALRLSGEGQWVGGRLRFTGEAEARPDAEAALANLLNIIGRRSGNRSRIAIG